MRPSKRHHGKEITIEADANCLDAGTTITGRYEHIARSATFRIYYGENERFLGTFHRDEWSIQTAADRLSDIEARSRQTETRLAAMGFFGS